MLLAQRSYMFTKILEAHLAKSGAEFKYSALQCKWLYGQSRFLSDMVGPPDSKSNLRPFKYYVPEDETPFEREFRLKREELHAWNQSFWASHNERFAKEKEKFVHQRLQEKYADNPENSTRVLTSDDMSVFYKKFLDENKNRHAEYNREWYRRNVSLLWPALKIWIRRLFVKS